MPYFLHCKSVNQFLPHKSKSVVVSPLSKSDSIVFPEGREKSLVNLIRFVLQHSTPDTKLHLAADVCTRTCIQHNLLQTSILLQELRQKEKLVQDKLQCYTDPKSSEECQAQPDNSYARMGQDFLLTQLEEIQAQIALVDKLRSFLEQQGETISKQKLVEFFSPGSSSSGTWEFVSTCLIWF